MSDKGAEHETDFEEAALELVGIALGGQPHWKFIEKQFIEKLKQAHAAGRHEAIAEVLPVLKKIATWADWCGRPNCTCRQNMAQALLEKLNG